MRWVFTIFFALLVTAALGVVLFYPFGESRQEERPDRAGKDQLDRVISPPHQFANEDKRTPPTPEAPALSENGDPGEILVLDWEDMIPADWQPDLFFQEYDLDALEDDDALAVELLDKLQQVWSEAPVVAELDGRRVRLPGFAVPIDAEPGQVSEFLLVPYFGACIHVPPPPANQTVYIKAQTEGTTFKIELFDTVWIQGTMRAQRFSGELAEAGYTIEAESVEPYEDDKVLTLE